MPSLIRVEELGCGQHKIFDTQSVIGARFVKILRNENSKISESASYAFTYIKWIY